MTSSVETPFSTVEKAVETCPDIDFGSFSTAAECLDNNPCHDFTLYPSPQQTVPGSNASPELPSTFTTTTTTTANASPDGFHNSTEPKSRKRPALETSPGPQSKSQRREANTQAARRYRQKKVDRVNELEAALAAVSRERDELKLKLAGAETEMKVLRRMADGR
ncbi:hypothetical protein MBLNU230_g0286t1 [Neophaeotheca triangularis]